jgi:hypothetical protein
MDDINQLTETELIELLTEQMQRENEPGHDGFFTMGEIAKIAGWGLAKTRRKMRQLHNNSQVVAKRVKRPNIIGDVSRVPGYKIVKDGKK